MGERRELRTGARLATGGEAVARAADGRVVFVRGAAPGEDVEAVLTEVRRRFARAEVVRVISPGAHRISPPCPHQSTCGGCPLMHLEPEAEARGKLEAGLDTFARIGRLPARALSEVSLWRGAAEGARTRARVAFEADRVGFREARSHRVADIDRCLALHPALERAREVLAAALRARPPRENRGERFGVLEVELITDGENVALRLPPELADLAPRLESAGLRTGPEPLETSDAAGRLLLRPEVFAQASLTGNAALIEEVERALPASGRLALELYAGSGNLTRLLAARFERVVAVEVSEPAVALGRRLGLRNVEWRVGAASSLDGALRPELVLVDPPRAGLEPAVRALLSERLPPRLVYVSCDVGTLARDARGLIEASARVERLVALDLYPRTPHLEWVLTLAA